MPAVDGFSAAVALTNGAVMPAADAAGNGTPIAYGWLSFRVASGRIASLKRLTA
jgi:hypothetical protein